MRPRICFIATGLARGGAELQLFNAAIGLRNRGFDVHVICLLSHDYWGARLEEAGVPVSYLRAQRTTNPLKILVRLRRCLVHLRPVATVGWDYPGSMLARAGGALTGIPVVVSSIHSEYLGGRLRRLALALTDGLATVTTAVSHQVARKLVESGTAPDRVRVISNGIDLTTVGPHLRRRRSTLRRELGIGDREFFWFAAGSLEAPKDYPNLLAAAAALGAARRTFKVLIAGAGSLLEELQAQVASLGLEGTVSFLGLRHDVPECMAAADATVLASAWEGLPTVVIESLAVGTPVVCTDVGGVREIVTHGHSGLVVPPRDPQALAGAMWALMARTGSARREMGAAGRLHVERRFALDRVVDRWSGLLGELLRAA